MSLNLHISLSVEQRMLHDSVSRYLEKAYGFQDRQRMVASGAEFDAAKWQDFADMGWLGLPLPAAYGGAGGNALDLLVLMQGFGRALVVEPYLGSVVLCGMTVAKAGTPAQRDRILSALASGQQRMAYACAEPHADYDLLDVRTLANKDGDEFVLDGEKSVVLGAGCAQLLLVSARTAGQMNDRAGLSLFLVDRSAPGVSLRSYATIDGRRAAEVSLRQVRVGSNDVLGPLHGAAPLLEYAQTMGTIALLGEAVGCLEGALAHTVQYHKDRIQFGKPLSHYQALRHRVADLYVATEETRALCMLAAHAWADNEPDAQRAVAGAKAWVGSVGRRAAEDAVQLHGAIAITDEYAVGHYLKRIVAIDRSFGDSSEALDRYHALSSPLQEPNEVPGATALES